MMSIAARFSLMDLGRWVRTALLALAWTVYGTAAHAEASPNEIAWVQTDADQVARFVVVIGPTTDPSGSSRMVDVGRPKGEPIGGNRTLFRAVVSMAPQEYVAVAAVGHEGLASDLSGWMTTVPTQPGQPRLATP
jgi:hypothetical protein